MIYDYILKLSSMNESKKEIKKKEKKETHFKQTNKETKPSKNYRK